MVYDFKILETFLCTLNVIDQTFEQKLGTNNIFNSKKNLKNARQLLWRRKNNSFRALFLRNDLVQINRRSGPILEIMRPEVVQKIEAFYLK